jgi:hypothetical protein
LGNKIRTIVSFVDPYPEHSSGLAWFSSRDGRPTRITSWTSTDTDAFAVAPSVSSTVITKFL